MRLSTPVYQSHHTFPSRVESALRPKKVVVRFQSESVFIQGAVRQVTGLSANSRREFGLPVTRTHTLTHTLNNRQFFIVGTHEKYKNPLLPLPRSRSSRRLVHLTVEECRAK